MARGTFQGNLQGTPSRPLEMLTSSKAVTASYAETASRLGVGKVGDSGNPVYFNNGIPVADSKTKGIVDWVTDNSGSISGVTGSSADVAVRVTGLEGKSGSWDSSSKWVGDNSASLLNPATLIISKSLGVPSAGNISYNPFKSASITIAVPSTPGHIGAAPANHTHSTSQVNGLDAFTASVKSDLAEISGKTGSYAPKDDYLPIGGGTITGSLVINNDLTVKGTTVSIDAQNLNVKDKLILVASGSNTRAAADGAGIAVPTASAGEGGAARIQYDGTNNIFTASVGFKAPSFTGSLRGNVTGTASFATSASKAISSSYANTATSASEATHAVSASEAVHAITASHAVNAKTALTASYLEGGASLVVDTASYAKTASVAQKVAWTAVDGRPGFYTASFVAGAFSGVQFNPTGGFAQVKVPSTTTHITGLDAVTASVKQMVAKSASWDNVANTASAAYAAASQALATASVAQKEAESASYWKTEASKSAASASTFKTTAQTAATQANAASQSAKSASNAANEASQSAKTAATVATNWSLSASNAANIANAASASAQSASNAANVASQSAKTAATTAQGWVTTASKAAQDVEDYRDTASGSMEDARFYSSQAATNATLSSTYAVQSSASAQLAAASASSAATYATRAQQSASNAHTSKNSAAASASAAAASATTAANWAVSASASATRISASTVEAAQYASNASASASLLYSSVGSELHPVYMKTTGPVAIQEGVDEFIEDTRASAVAAFTGVSRDTSLYQGKTIRFRLHYAGASNATLNLTLADGTTTGAIPIYFSNTTRLSTQYATNNVIELTYSASVWKVVNPYTNSNTTYPRAVTGSATPVTASHIPIYTKTLAGTALTEVEDSGIEVSGSVIEATASYALIAESVKDGAGLVVNTASYALDAAIKYGGHYTPSASGATAQGSTAARTYLKTISTDGKGHVVGFTTGSESNDGVTSIAITTASNYVTVDNAAAVTSTGTRKIDLSAATKGKVESGSAAHTWITANSGNISSATSSAHTHGNKAFLDSVESKFLPITGGTVTGDVVISANKNLTVGGNLYVNGTASYVNTQDLVVKDKLVLLSSGSTTQALADGAGIAIQTASAATVANAEKAAARFQYRSSDNKFTASVGIVAPDFTGNLTGTSSYATKAGSADSATVATGLGVAANTSASVAAAIAAKWTYNENTIKAVKVNSASRADSAATADSATSATTATTASYNRAGADAQAWIVENGPSALADTKVTSAANHYTPAKAGTSGSSTARYYIKTIDVDAKGHITGVTTGNETVTNTDTKVTAVGNHYTPAQSTAKSVSSGQAVVGIGVDAAGHVVSVTGSNTITSASRAASAASADSATVATGLGVAANTSASVAAAINAKWTYNENTIKGVKVTSASRADSAATAGSATSASRAVSAASADSVAWGNVSGKPSTFAPSAHDHNRITTPGDQRSVATSPNDYQDTLQFRGLKTAGVIGLSTSNAYAYVVGLRGWQDRSGGDSHEFAYTNEGVYHRIGNASETAWGAWSKIIESTDTSSWASAAANSHTHSNKAVLDGITSIKVSNWDTAYGWGNHASAGYAKQASANNFVHSGNEITLVPSSYSGDLFINYRTVGGSADGNITGYRLCDGKGGTLAYITANTFNGTASRADSAASADSATSAGKLSTGTTGNVGQAVYFSNGTPALTDIGQVACPGTSSAAGSGGTVTLQPGVVTNLGSLTGNVTIALANGNENVNGHCPVYCAVFTSSGGSITLPAEIDISENSVDIEDDGLKYEISIMNNLAIVVRAAS